MAKDKRKSDERDPEARIDALDNEDLGIEELLDIQEKIEAKIEELERQSDVFSGDPYGEKMPPAERKHNLEEKERIAEDLEALETQKQAVQERLEALEGSDEREND
jgi:hypothetical protein